MAMNRPALFVDKDGTLIENVPYNVDPEQIRLRPAAAGVLRRFRERGFAIVVVSNQPGVARGHFDESRLAGVRERIEALLAADGASLDAFYWCPHAPENAPPCACRKPAPGLLRRAARELGLDLERSWMIGDILDDIEAGSRAGCRTVLLDGGGETEWFWTLWRVPDLIVTSWSEVERGMLSCREVTDERGVAMR